MKKNYMQQDGETSEPWKVNKDEALEFIPLFQRNEAIELAETKIDPRFAVYFLFGFWFAKAHGDGFLMYDWTSENTVANPQTGQIICFDPGAITHVEISPANMAQQFTELYGSYGPEIFKSILGGYAKESYYRLDPLYPDFTDTLLDIVLGGEPISTPRPRVSKHTMQSELLAWSVSVFFDTNPTSIQIVDQPRLEPSFSDALIHTLTTYSLAGIDCAAWIEACRTRYEKSENTQIGEILCSLGSSHFTDVLARQFPNETALKSLLEILAELYRRSDVHSNEDVSPIAKQQRGFSLFFKQLQTLPENEKILMSDRVIDGIFELAKYADEAGQLIKSMEYAQLAQIYTQKTDAYTFRYEQAIRYTVAQQRQYSWSDPTNLDLLDRHTFFVYTQITHSFNITRLKFFEHSCDRVKEGSASNALWSDLWDSISDSRILLLNCSNFIAGATNANQKGEDTAFYQMVERVVSMHYNLLRTHAESSMMHSDKYFFWLDCWVMDPNESGIFELRQELEAIQKLVESIKKTTEKYSEFHEILEGFVSFIQPKE